MKLLVIAACMVSVGPDQMEAVEQGGFVNVDKAQAETLTRFNRALYCAKSDDPTKGKLTADADMIAAAEKLSSKKAKAAKEPAAAGAGAAGAGGAGAGAGESGAGGES